MLTSTGTAAPALYPSHVMGHLGRECCSAKLYIQTPPLTFQFVLRDSLYHFFFLFILIFRLQAATISVLSWHVCFNATATGAAPTARGTGATITCINQILHNKLKTAEQTAAGSQSFTEKAEQPLQGQQLMFCSGGLGGTVLAASANLKARLSFRQALGLWMPEGESVLL